MRSTYIIWKSVKDQNVRNVNDVIGLFEGTHEEADSLIARLNAADPSVEKGWGEQPRYGYWRSEPTFITPTNEHEFLQF